MHHEEVINNLKFMKENGVEAWIKQQNEKNICKKCDKYILWYEKNTHKCSKK